MTETEDFLARWSRLKREAAKETSGPQPKSDASSKPTGDGEKDDPYASKPHQPGPALSRAANVPQIDLSTLPPIESITATTDIRPFLAAGVPEDLQRAALRRAWVADPAIRDFIGIAENQWDFTAPNGVPGFDAVLALEDVRRLAAQLMGESQSPGERPRSSETAPSPTDASKSSSCVGASTTVDTVGEGGDGALLIAPRDNRTDHRIVQRSEADSATQNNDHARWYSAVGQSRPPRRGGGALPR